MINRILISNYTMASSCFQDIFRMLYDNCDSLFILNGMSFIHPSCLGSTTCLSRCPTGLKTAGHEPVFIFSRVDKSV